MSRISETDTVSVIDTATNTVVATVPVGVWPLWGRGHPGWDTRLRHEYWPVCRSVHPSANTVSVIHTATNTVVKTIPVGTGPVGVAVTPDGTKVYVTTQPPIPRSAFGTYDVGYFGSVSVIHRPGDTVVKTIPVGTGPVGVAVTPDGTKVYVANYDSKYVSVIARPGNTVVATVRVGSGPIAVAVTPDGKHAYVAHNFNTVSVIDTATNTRVGSPIPVGEVQGLAVTPDGTHVYVTNSDNTVSVIRTATNTVVKTVPVGTQPIGDVVDADVAVTPDGTRVYVANNGSNNVTVIARPGNTVVATVPVGHGPWGVAIGP